MPDTTTQREGARGGPVLELQLLLISKGFNAGKVDGVFGPTTKAAVMAFQRANGLAADGLVGPKTWGALRGGVSPTTPPPPTGQGTAAAFVQKALSQQGDQYKFGAEAGLNDPNPKAFDCSELVQWAAHQVGVTKVPDGSAAQLKHVQKISVDEAIRTPGALLFRPGHVAISQGNGQTIEARGKKYGVGVFSAHGRRWSAGGRIPGMRY